MINDTVVCAARDTFGYISKEERKKKKSKVSKPQTETKSKDKKKKVIKETKAGGE